MRKVVVAWDVRARTGRRPSLVEDGRVLQWDFGRLVVVASFLGRRVVTVTD